MIARVTWQMPWPIPNLSKTRLFSSTLELTSRFQVLD